MPTIKEDKKCPKCGNIDEQSIDESFSHFDDAFHFEYQCRRYPFKTIKTYMIL